MIIGVIPIGGKGVRLGLPYSKEMLPQKNFLYYNPIVNHVVQKMLGAGAEQIVFVHGTDYKEDVRSFFKEERFVHILQKQPGFASTLKDAIEGRTASKILFGLPDSIFLGNPFLPMLLIDGVVCGLFTTNNDSKVDRVRGKNFDVKKEKTESNSNYFWGVLKFDYNNLQKFIEDEMFERYSEIGDILNQYDKSMIKNGPYIDIGTWQNYNLYMKEWYDTTH